MTQIVIEGDKVKYVREVIEKEISLESLLETLVTRQNHQVPFLPDNCRSFVEKENDLAFIIERPPGIKNLLWQDGGDGRDYNFKLYMPWSYLAVLLKKPRNNIYGVGIAWSKKRVDSVKSPMFVINHPNVYMYPEKPAVYCLGGVDIQNKLPLHRGVNDLVDKIYTGAHNWDLWNPGMNILAAIHLPKGIDTDGERVGQKVYLKAWEKLSKTKTQKQLMEIVSTPEIMNYGEFLAEIGRFDLRG